MRLPKRIIALVLEWAFEHRDELMEDWELARAKKPLNWNRRLLMHIVRNVTYVSDYKLLLSFDDGSTRLVDLA